MKYIKKGSLATRITTHHLARIPLYYCWSVFFVFKKTVKILSHPDTLVVKIQQKNPNKNVLKKKKRWKKNLKVYHVNTCDGFFFCLQLVTLLNMDSNTDVFLVMFQNFSLEQLTITVAEYNEPLKKTFQILVTSWKYKH